jgi:mono/diheme cytochrome c family protein
MRKALPRWMVAPVVALTLLAAELRLAEMPMAGGSASGAADAGSVVTVFSVDPALVAQASTTTSTSRIDQAGSSPAKSVPATTRTAGTPTSPLAVVRVYQKSCMECHDVDGRGEAGRETLPSIPDFTNARWHSSRSDAELSRSILEGKGKSMPRMKAKLGSVDVKQMVAFVRAFQGGKQIVDDEPEPPSAPERPVEAADPSGRNPQPAQPDQKEVTAQETRRLFQKSCALCHGRDGTGSSARDNLPAIPNFTVLAWQQKRSDPQLVVSILEGKGSGMPPFRDKIARERVRDLMAFVRTFAPGMPQRLKTAPDDFEVRFRQLTQEFEDLGRQIRSLSNPTP